ncbi:MAG: hypothetical protein AAGL24_05255, partial [Pseudomonadota bacterium]
GLEGFPDLTAEGLRWGGLTARRPVGLASPVGLEGFPDLTAEGLRWGGLIARRPVGLASPFGLDGLISRLKAFDGAG